MPHAALIAAAISAGVGTAVAFELGVFRPWREINWPDGIAEGIKREWQEFSDDMKDGFREISGDLRRQRDQRRRDQQFQNFNQRNSDDVEEEMQLRREMDEYSLHENQSTALRSRYTSEFGDDGMTRRRTLQGAKAEDNLRGEDLHLDPLDSRLESYEDAPMASIYHDIMNLSSPVTVSQHLDNDTSIRTLSPSSASQQPSFQQCLSSPSTRNFSHADHSSPSITHTDSIQGDWQSQLSTDANGTISNNDDDEDDSESASWVELTDSRPSSPRSPTWTDHEAIERRR